MKKRVFPILMVFLFFLLKSVSAAEVKIDTNKIYFLDDADKEFVTMPSSYKMSAKITVTGADVVTYTSTDNSRDMSVIQVTSTGIVTISPYYCSSGSVVTCTTAQNDNLLKRYKEKKADIIVMADGEEYKVSVQSVDYSNIYIDQFFDSIIQKYPSDTSTDRGKIQPILDWISKETDYSANYSYTKSMIFHSAGDCWASSRAIVDFAKKVGVEAVVRTGAKYADVSVGAGHENVYAELDGKGYVIEAGYNEKKPRKVSIGLTDNGWYTGNPNYTIGSTYTSYNGFAKNVSVPENSVMNGVGNWVIQYGLSGKSKIETLHVPKTITKISSNSFADVPTLKSITVDSNNPNYTSYDGALFTKDKKTLMTYPSAKGSKKNTLYNFIEILDSYAFSYNNVAEELIIPEGVKTLKTNAITGNRNLHVIDVASSVEVIENNAINQTPDYVIIRGSNTQIASLPCGKSITIFGHKGSTAEEYATTNECHFTSLEDIDNDTTKIKKITLDAVQVNSVTYTGSPVVPEYTITIDGKTLVENRDFVVEEFKNNINAGNAYFYLHGIGYYVGRIIVNFNIDKKEIDWEYTNPVVDYTGEAQSPLVVVKDSFFKGKISYPIYPYHPDKRVKAEYTEPGEYELGLNIDGDYNYKIVYQYITFKIKGIDISKATIENIPSYVYTSQREYLDEIQNKKVQLNGKVLVKDTDYTTKITSVRTDDTNNRVYCLTITGKGLYEGTVQSNEFVIATNYDLLTNYQDGQFIKPNQTFQLKISSNIQFPLDQGKFTYQNYNEDIVSISENGKITALKEGTAKILIKSTSYGKSVYLNVRVASERIPTEVMVLSRGVSKTSINVSGTIRVYSYFYPSNTTDSKMMTYQSSDESVITVDQTGLVTGVHEGVAYVTAITSGGLTDRIKIVVGSNPVQIPLTSISLLKYPNQLEVGDIYTNLNIGFNPSDTTIDRTLKYRSSNSNIANIDTTGKIQALKVGTTYIIINANDEYSQVFELKVVPKKSLTLDKNTLTLEGNSSLTNHQYKLHPILTNITGTVSYKSSNTNVAEVKSDGTVIAKSTGTAVITASVGSYKAECKVTVHVHPSSITLSKKSLTLEEGASLSISVTYNPSNTSVKDLTWKSSNTNVATVNNGVITAKSAGTAVITATSKNNKSATVTVIVTEKEILPDSVAISNPISSLGISDEYTFVPSFNPSNTNNIKVFWFSSNTAVATINANGVIKALKEGTTTITVKTVNNKSVSIKISIIKKLIQVDSVSFDTSVKELGVGETFSLVPIILPNNATNKTITWSSSNSKIVTVDQNGVIQAIDEGSAVITAKSHNGKEASITIHSSYKEPSVYYMTHVQDYGDQKYVRNGAMAGTAHESKRLEAIRMYLKWSKYSGDISYRTHVQDYGWMNYVKNGEMSGTSGQSKRLEAIQIQLTGEISNYYNVYYRVHAQDVGWMNWAMNGEMSGTASYGRRLEGIEIVLVRKGENPPQRNDIKTNKSFLQKQIVYSTHVQDYGWQGEVFDGMMSGTAHESKRLEGIKIHFHKPQYMGDILYRTHVQDYGWQEFKKNGEMSGTSGESKRLEAIEIKLTGELENHYDIYYRVHAQNIGWMNWAKNGEASGTAHYSYRLEAIEIVLVDKGEIPPIRNDIKTEQSFIDRNA